MLKVKTEHCEVQTFTHIPDGRAEFQQAACPKKENLTSVLYFHNSITGTLIGVSLKSINAISDVTYGVFS